MRSIEPDGAVVAITGVTSGIGRGIATVLTGLGAKVVGNGRRLEKGQELEAELAAARGEFGFVQGDVTVRADAERLVAETVARHGRLDVLINNAGTVGERPLRPLEEIDDAFWRMMVDTNLTSILLGCQAGAPALRASGGTIINVGSGAGEGLGIDLLAYRAAKAGAMHLSRCLALALAGDGVRVHTLVMHSVETEGGDRVLDHRTESMSSDEAAAVRAKRALVAVQPTDVGRGIVELLHDPEVQSGPGYVVG